MKLGSEALERITMCAILMSTIQNLRSSASLRYSDSLLVQQQE